MTTYPAAASALDVTLPPGDLRSGLSAPLAAAGSCVACGSPRVRGALLLVIDVHGIQPDATVCRPSVHPHCLGWAGHVGQTAIALLDPDEARDFDRRRDGQ